MKMALSDFSLRKKGIYGILHVIILLLSLFLVISISIDTFKGIPFYTQSVYMKVSCGFVSCSCSTLFSNCFFRKTNGTISVHTSFSCWWRYPTRILYRIWDGLSLPK